MLGIRRRRRQRQHEPQNPYAMVHRSQAEHERALAAAGVGQPAAAAKVATDAWIAGRGGPIAAIQFALQLDRLSGDIARAREAEEQAARAQQAAADLYQRLAYLNELKRIAALAPHPEVARGDDERSR